MQLGLKGKRALVAAASRGLGRAVAEELAAEGCDLLICARGEHALESARTALQAAHDVEVFACRTDLSLPAEVDALIENAKETMGGVDILVTNTGGPPVGLFTEHSPDAWQAAFDQNLQSVLNLTRGVLAGMKERGWGRILNVTSIAVKQPVDQLILSNSLRAAVTGFAKSLANEVAPFGITVNNVLPGYTHTDRVAALAQASAKVIDSTAKAVIAGWEQQIPMGRLGTPREFAALVAFLASDRASYITGNSIPVDGGWVRALY